MVELNRNNVAAMAAAITLAMAATAAMAAGPAPGQLPGQGKLLQGIPFAVTVDNVAHTMGITLNKSLPNPNVVIDWGKGTAATDLNPTGMPGFNIGEGAKVTFSNGGGVLNIDSTGNPSQIFGAVDGGKSKVFVANANGIIIGATAVIGGSGSLNFVANTLVDTAADFFANGTLTNYQGSGGDVTVQKGAHKSGGSTLLMSGGGTVNVDLTGGFSPFGIIVSAGVKGGLSPLATNNAAASAIVVGAGTILSSLRSAGAATTSGTLTVADASGVSGVLTNQGVLTLTAPTTGTLLNRGELTTTGAATFTSLTNAGTYTAGGTLNLAGGSLTNGGAIVAGGAISVQHGSIINTGSIDNVTSLATTSDSSVTTYSDAGDYSIDNSGVIAGHGSLSFDANATGRAGGSADKSMGSFANTGTLITADSAGTGDITALGYDDVTLAGALNLGTLASNTASTANRLLGRVEATATNGTSTVAAPVFFDGSSNDFVVGGEQVKVMGNVTGLSAPGGISAGYVYLHAGDPVDGDYAIRIGSGATISSGGIFVQNLASTDTQPNVILQGTLSAPSILFGGSSAKDAVSGLYSGPAGSLVATGATPTVTINFTGAVKTAKYLNAANNFRYNYLPITNKGTSALQLTLNPVAYTTNGTSNGLSAVNVLVNGDVTLAAPTFAPPPTLINGVGQTAVTGVTNLPNTHLVVQSTGNIGAAANYYWPGYVYLGTIDSNTDGSPAAGTLSANGIITLNGNFSNVLPGDVAGASGIHFMSAKVLLGIAGGSGYKVTTNANAWVTFPTDLQTQIYAQGIVGDPTFFGGTATGLVVNYGKLDASMFRTRAPDATR